MQLRSHHNQRQFSRSQVTIAGTLQPESGDAFGVQVIDLSMNGARLQAEQRLPLGSRAELTMLIGQLNQELPLRATAVVVRGDEACIAVKFERVALDSLPTIQHVIIEHAEDPDQAEMEISSHGGWIFTPE